MVVTNEWWEKQVWDTSKWEKHDLCMLTYWDKQVLGITKWEKHDLCALT